MQKAKVSSGVPLPKRKRTGRGGFLKGAAYIAAGGFIAKVIGALYRIPLTNLIGGHGLGLYQMVYPVYCTLLTVSATGIPSSIAKLTAERVRKGETGRSVFRVALRLFLIIGGVGTAVMCAVAPLLTALQGSREVLGGYFALAPSVFLVSAISVFRGYFQGKNNMLPTALSEVVEQAVKVGFGLLFAYLFRGDVQRAVTYLLFSVTVSEGVALLLMIILFRRDTSPRLLPKTEQRTSAKTVLKLSVPVTLSSMILPLSGLLDSVLAPRFLGAYSANAVTLYGLFSGGAVTIVNLPVSVCYGIAAASVPAVASAGVGAQNKRESPRRRILYALAVTVAVALPSALALFFFAEPVVRVVFRALSVEESRTLIGLVKAFSFSALTLSCVQTLSACLTAQGKPQYAALAMLIGVTAKTGLYVWWLQNPKISVFALAYATNVCYLVAFLLDLVYNLTVSKKRKGKER